MNTCKACKFFEPNEKVSSVGKCASEHVLEGYHIELVEIEAGQILVENDERWGMFVSQDFGCIHHTVKE